MFDWEVLELGVKVDMEDGEYEDSEGYSLVVKNGEIVEGGGYGIELK